MATSTVDIVRKLRTSAEMQYGQIAWDAEPVDATGGDWLPKVSAGNGQAFFDCLYVGGAAARDVSIVTVPGHTVVFKNVQPGSFVPCAGTKVTQANTTALANEIVALYG